MQVFIILNFKKHKFVYNFHIDLQIVWIMETIITSEWKIRPVHQARISVWNFCKENNKLFVSITKKEKRFNKVHNKLPENLKISATNYKALTSQVPKMYQTWHRSIKMHLNSLKISNKQCIIHILSQCIVRLLRKKWAWNKFCAKVKL